MNARPAICPACGELVIAWILREARALMLPIHPDRVAPTGDCVASARTVRDGRILSC